MLLPPREAGGTYAPAAESPGMSSADAPRVRISDIIRNSGKMGTDTPGMSPEQLASMAAAISGTPAAAVLASQELSDELAKRFPKLSPTSALERDFEAPYEMAGRALVLALQACGFVLGAAFDTGSGAMLEVKKPMSLLAVPFTVTVTIVDRGATTHFSGQAQHTGVDWGGKNAKLLNQLFDKTNDYLKLFRS